MYDGPVVEGGAAGITLLTAVMPVGYQWSPSSASPATKVVIKFRNIAGGAAVVGLCRYNVPGDCMPSGQALYTVMPMLMGSGFKK